MFIPYDDIEYDEISASECNFEDVLNEENQRLRLQMSNEYTQSTMKAVLGAYFDKKEIGTASYYQLERAIISEPCSDKESDSQLKNITQVLANVDVSLADTLIFPVAEEQPLVNKRLAGTILGLPWLNSLNTPRNHWVTVHYDMLTGMATLIDSKTSLAAAWYDYRPLQIQLKEGLRSLGLALNGFNVVYQGVQTDNVHCGAWTVANICAVAKGSAIEELLYECSIDEIIEAQIAKVFHQDLSHSHLEGDCSPEAGSISLVQENIDECSSFSTEETNSIEESISLDLVDSSSVASDEHEPSRLSSEKRWSDLVRITFDETMKGLENFLNQELSEEEFYRHKEFLSHVISDIQKIAEQFFDSSPENRQKSFSQLHGICAHYFDVLDIQFKPRDSLLFYVQTFFKALVGLLLAVVASVLTFGLASIYVLCKKDLRQQYRDTFFQPETRPMIEMKAKWQSAKFRDAFFAENGWLDQVKLNQFGLTI